MPVAGDIFGSALSRRRGRRGFTLLELMIVLLIMGLLAGASIPLFRRTYTHLQLEVFSYDLAKLCEYAGHRAVTTGKAVRVHFVPQARQYWLLEAEAALPDSAFDRIPGRVGLVQTVPEALSLSPSAQDVTFYPDGRAEPFRVVILDRARQEYTLTTQVWTGRVTLAKTAKTDDT